MVCWQNPPPDPTIIKRVSRHQSVLSAYLDVLLNVGVESHGHPVPVIDTATMSVVVDILGLYIPGRIKSLEQDNPQSFLEFLNF